MKNNIKAILFLTLISLFFFMSREGRAGWVPQRHFTVDDGLPQSIITDIMKDSRGFIWLASNGGVSRFDGHIFHNYSVANGYPFHLVTGIIEKEPGVFWVADYASGLYELKDEQVRKLQLPFKTPDARINFLRKEKDNTILISLAPDGLIVCKNDSMQDYFDVPGYEDEPVISAVLDQEGAVWVGTFNRGAFRMKDGRVLQTVTEEDGLPGSDVRSILPMANGRVWFGTNDGLFVLGDKSLSDDFNRKYPHSLYAPTALFKAAEACYRRSSHASKIEQRDLLRQAGIYLYRIVCKYPRNRLIPSAYLGLALVYSRINPAAMDIGLSGLERVQGDVAVSFAGVTGKVRDMIDRITRMRVLSKGHPQRYIAGTINPPLKRLYLSPVDLGGRGAVVLRDSAGQPIRYGKDIFLIKAGQIIRFDPSAGSFEEGIVWETPKVVNVFAYGYVPHTPQAAIVSDSAILAVATSAEAVGVDIKTGKVLWKRRESSRCIPLVDEDRIITITSRRIIHGYDSRTGKLLLSQRLPSRESLWGIPPQTANGLLLVCTASGSTRTVNIWEIDTGKFLRSISVFSGEFRSAYLSPDGLLLIRTTESLRLYEPVLGIELWEMKVSSSPSRTIVGIAGRYLFVSSADKPGMLLMRDIMQQGVIVRTFQLSPVGLRPSYPAYVDMVGHRLYVVASSTFRASAWSREPLKGRIISCYEPTLHALDVDTGKELWSVSLTPPGATRRRHYFVMPMQVGKSHISILVKDLFDIRHPHATAMLINRSDGKICQYLKISDASGLNSRSRYTRQMILSSPVMVNGHVVVETYKGVEVYGKVEK